MAKSRLRSKTGRERNPAWYALRRTLPLFRFEENLRELEKGLPHYRIDELIVKVDAEDFSHGQPPLAWVRAYQEKLFRLKALMDRLGIIFSINPWITLGHRDAGRDGKRDLPGLRTMVGHDGAASRVCACPLSPVWRRHIATLWTLYAETKPQVIWIEDDFRCSNHGPVAFGCFCPDHLRRFSRRLGRPVSRAEVVKAIFQPGPAHPWRAAYLAMQDQIMTETAAFLAKTVHKVSPNTFIGLMSGGVRRHCLDGRSWRKLAAAISKRGKFYSRPPIGRYSESSLRALYLLADHIKATRHCLPPGAVEQTEVENFPYSRYSKSVNYTFLSMAVSFAFGCQGIAANLYDHCGNPMTMEPAYGEMLREKKAFLNALALETQRPGRYRGTQILFHERESDHKPLPPGAGPEALFADGWEAVELFESFGLPTTYDDSPVLATSGQVLRSFSDREVRSFLKRGLLLDAAAAQVLYERGFGAEIGLKTMTGLQPIDALGALSAEEFFNSSFGGKAKTFLSLPHGRSGGMTVLTPLPGARIISRMVDPEARPGHPALYGYENQLGGRVVVSAFELATGFAIRYLNPLRLRQLQAVHAWLWRNQMPVSVGGDGVYPLCFRRDLEDQRCLLGFFNLSLDPWSQVVFTLDADQTIKKTAILTQDGIWRPAPALAMEKRQNRLYLTYSKPVAYDQPLFISVSWQ